MTSPNYRMIPDGRKGGGVANFGDHKVTASANTFLDVPLENAYTLNGWTNCGKVGPTAARPSNAESGETFMDTTLGYIVIADGLGYWHNPATGGVV